MRLFAILFLIAVSGTSLSGSSLRLRLPVEEANPAPPQTNFGELELAERLRNPLLRKELVGQTIDVVGELTLFDAPDPKTGRIKSVGFSKTHGKVIYRVWCRLKEPLSTEQFDQISNASFVTLRGVCSVHSRTKAVGSDLWYDFTISLAAGEIVYSSGPHTEDE